MKPLHIAALVKQVPKAEDMQLGPDGRLQREGVELSMNPYCLRAVSKGIELAQQTGGRCTVISMGDRPRLKTSCGGAWPWAPIGVSCSRIPPLRALTPWRRRTRW